MAPRTFPSFLVDLSRRALCSGGRSFTVGGRAAMVTDMMVRATGRIPGGYIALRQFILFSIC